MTWVDSAGALLDADNLRRAFRAEMKRLAGMEIGIRDYRQAAATLLVHLHPRYIGLKMDEIDYETAELDGGLFPSLQAAHSESSARLHYGGSNLDTAQVSSAQLAIYQRWSLQWHQIIFHGRVNEGIPACKEASFLFNLLICLDFPSLNPTLEVIEEILEKALQSRGCPSIVTASTQTG
jgi:hypothetical protein